MEQYGSPALEGPSGVEWYLRLNPPLFIICCAFFHKGEGEGLCCGKILHTQSVLRIVITQA